MLKRIRLAWQFFRVMANCMKLEKDLQKFRQQPNDLEATGKLHESIEAKGFVKGIEYCLGLYKFVIPILFMGISLCSAGDIGFWGPQLTISEADGSPKRKGVYEVIVPTDSLTINGGIATLRFSTSSSGGDWSTITGIPAGFADNVDNDSGAGSSAWQISGSAVVVSTHDVGIGITVPLAKVHISSAAGTSNMLLKVSTGTTDLLAVGPSSATFLVPIYGNGANITALTAANVSAGSLGAAVLVSSVANSAIGTNQIADGSVAVGDLNATSVATSFLSNSSATATYQPLDADLTDLADGSLTTSKIAAGSLGSSVLASSITLASMYGAPTLVGTNFTSLPGAQVGSGVPAANIATGSLGAQVLASSITVASMWGAPTLTGTNITAIPTTALANGTLNVGVKITTTNVAAAGGTASATTWWRGDNNWAAPAGGGDAVLANAQTFTGFNTFSAGVSVASITMSGNPPVISSTHSTLSLRVSADGGSNYKTYNVHPASMTAPNGYRIDYATYSYCLSVSSGTGWDSFAALVTRPGGAATITEVRSECLQTGATVQYRLEERAWAAGSAAGANIFTVTESSATAGGVIESSFANADIAANAGIYAVTDTSAGAGTPAMINVCVYWKYD